MKYIATVTVLMLLTVSCSVENQRSPAALSQRVQDAVDLQWHYPPVSLLITIESIGLHPGTGAALISQVKARIVEVRVSSLPPCKHVVFTISTDEAKDLTTGKQYLLTKGSGGGIIGKKNLMEQPATECTRF